MSKIDTSQVNRIAALARIGLSGDEATQMADELSVIVGFVEQLGTIDITDVAPTDQVTGLTDVWREDVVRPSLPREQLLANAPAQRDGYIVVGRVIGG